jgi:hypothetical protein
MRIRGLLFIACLLAGTAFSCKVEEEEQRKIDSLFLGISLGMDRKAFFDHCWELNKKHLVIHGPGNRNVEYRFKDPAFFRDSVIMRFYPTFHNDKIDEMPVVFTYYTWAPWNRQYWADTLLTEMVPYFEKLYGGNFKLLNHKTQGKVYYQMLGRRRINLFVRDEQFVQAVFTDLKVEKEKKEQAEAKAEGGQ